MACVMPMRKDRETGRGERSWDARGIYQKLQGFIFCLSDKSKDAEGGD